MPCRMFHASTNGTSPIYRALVVFLSMAIDTFHRLDHSRVKRIISKRWGGPKSSLHGVSLSPGGVIIDAACLVLYHAGLPYISVFRRCVSPLCVATPPKLGALA